MIRGYFEGFTARPGAGVLFDEEGASGSRLLIIAIFTQAPSFFHGEGDNKQFSCRYSFLVDEKS